MKLVALELLAFGPFTDYALDFSADALHVVFGKNEAGKSTALRAIHGLLFGIPVRTGDAHLHAMNELRLGARLRASDGAELAFTRRKGKKNTLSTLDGPLDEAVLARWLGGVSEGLFERMFGLDAARLREGARALIAGQGDVGESLFDASLGGRGIQRVLGELREEAAALFKARGKHGELNVALAAFKEAKTRRDHARLKPKAWSEQEQALAEARAERERWMAERRELVAERERLARIQSARKPMARRRELLARQAQLGEAPLLDESFAERRRRAEGELQAAERDLERARRDIARLETRRGELEHPDALAELDRARVEELRARLANHNKARADLPKQHGILTACEQELEAILKRLGKRPDLSEVEALRLSTEARARIERLRREYARVVERHTRAEREAQSLDKRRAALLGELGGVAGAEPPALETVERFEAEFAKLERRDERQEEGVETARKRAAEFARELDALARAGDVPSEAELERARARRAAGWQLVRRAWLERAKVDAEAREYSAELPLERAFEAAVEAADAVADRLRREAGRVSERARLEAELADVERERRRLEKKRSELARAGRALDAEWRGAWSEVGVEPLSPREMRGWLTRRSALARELENVARSSGAREAELADAAGELEAWRHAWGKALAPLGLRADADPEEAGAVIDDVTELMAQAENAERARRRIASMERDAQDLARDVSALLEEVTPDLKARPFEEATARLLDRYDDARIKRGKRDDVDRELEERRDALAASEAVRAQAASELEALMREAGASDRAALVEAETRSAEARSVLAELHHVEERLADVRAETPLSELARDLAATDHAHAVARLEEIARELDERNEQIDEVSQRIGSLDNGLAVMRGGSSAAEFAAEAEAHLAKARAAAERYVRLELAVGVLERELERFREQSQGPILARAGELFARLAVRDGARQFRGLTVDYGDDDQPALYCVREAGARVSVEEGLSDGTAEQLYLALRLASLERYAESGAALPLVLDDVLLHSDNERRSAALEVLGEFSQQSQVLLFTHDAHLVELARDALPAERLVCHELDRFSPASRLQPARGRQPRSALSANRSRS